MSPSPPVGVPRVSLGDTSRSGGHTGPPLAAVPGAGDRYIVADCGGGTVDLTVHQIEKPQGTLKELYKASGGLRPPRTPSPAGVPCCPLQGCGWAGGTTWCPRGKRQGRGGRAGRR